MELGRQQSSSNHPKRHCQRCGEAYSVRLMVSLEMALKSQCMGSEVKHWPRWWGVGTGRDGREATPLLQLTIARPKRAIPSHLYPRQHVVNTRLALALLADHAPNSPSTGSCNHSNAHTQHTPASVRTSFASPVAGPASWLHSLFDQGSLMLHCKLCVTGTSQYLL